MLLLDLFGLVSFASPSNSPAIIGRRKRNQTKNLCAKIIPIFMLCAVALENAEIIPLEFDAGKRYQIVTEINRLYKTFSMGQLVWFERADRANELDDDGIISRHNCASLIMCSREL